MTEHDAQNSETPKNFFLRKKRWLIAAMVIFFLGITIVAAGLKAGENPRFCANCHIIEPYYQSWKEGPLLAARHSAENVNCTDCHQATIVEKMHEGFAYVTGQYEDPLKERSATREDCLKCHQDDWQQTVTATQYDHRNPHDSHLGEIDCSLCHKMHRTSEVYCAQCHEFDWFKKLGSDWKQSQ
ncbi:cytochrome c3 [Acetonema longum]|uniref:Tetrahaem cytochrome domain-containing protein n=1 Tax=Acetonema longum DSM 6540 TaxID=1009370 RepID=F7NG63_9FIRM|nr:cytochrome c3 [Acetonema longum]EGO64981.1 hypothetical protein ALO_05248 [Acetonema longum DSM 6540]